MILVNALGDACPIPVVKTKNAIKELGGSGVVETLVDNEIAVQNLTKMANQKGYGVKSEKLAPNQFKVTMSIEGAALPSAPEEPQEEACLVQPKMWWWSSTPLKWAGSSLSPGRSPPGAAWPGRLPRRRRTAFPPS